MVQPDRELFDALVRAWRPSGLNLARRIMDSRVDAEDVVQTAIVRAYCAFGQYDGSRPFGAWMGRIIVNVCHDRRRAASRRPQVCSYDAVDEFNMEWPDDAPSVLDVMVSQAVESERRELALRVLSELPFMRRRVANAVYIDGLSINDTAAMCGISKSAVRAHMFHARQDVAKFGRVMSGQHGVTSQICI